MNKKISKILAAILATTMALSMSSCKKETNDSSDSSDSTSGTSEVTTSTEETTESSSETTTEAPTDTTAPVVSDFDTDAADTYIGGIYFNGVALISEDRQVVWETACGDADYENQVPNTMDTVFEFGSITKQFTAVAIMQLVEKGELSTDDTLDKYIPEYSHASEVTIHQLLNMTSGIPDYLYTGTLGFSMNDFSSINPTQLGSFEDLVRDAATTPITADFLISSISEFPLNFEPGTKYEYSNTNYYFLGIIIERLSGMPYDEYIRKNILEPLDLNELYPDIDHLTSKGRTSLLGGYIEFDFPSQDASISYAAGVMTGTAKGLLEWEYCVMDHKLLSEESWEKIFDGGDFGYGYGWSIGDGYVEHSGMTLGYNTNVRLDIENEKVIIVLSNCQMLVSMGDHLMSSDISDSLWQI